MVVSEGVKCSSGSGGSGIVIIKKLGAANPPALNFDGYNKLSIDNFTRPLLILLTRLLRERRNTQVKFLGRRIIN